MSSTLSAATHLCELNTSPWDVQPLTPQSDYYLQDEEPHWGKEAQKVVKKEEEDDLEEEYMRFEVLNSAAKNRVNTEIEAKTELGTEHADYIRCNSKAGAWQCKREAKEGRLTCAHHLTVKKSSYYKHRHSKKRIRKQRQRAYGENGRLLSMTTKTELATDNDYIRCNVYAQGWQCYREAKEGRRTCQYHLNMQKSSYQRYKSSKTKDRIVKERELYDEMWDERRRVSLLDCAVQDWAKKNKDENEYVRCNKKSGQGWQCKREAMRGRRFCEHHSGRAAGTNVAAKMIGNRERVLPDFPPTDYYYYSGFSPSYSLRRRKPRETDQTKNENKGIPSHDAIDKGSYSLLLLAQVCADLTEHKDAAYRGRSGMPTDSPMDLCFCPGFIPSWGAKGRRWNGLTKMQDKEIIDNAISQTSSSSLDLYDPDYDKDYSGGD